MSRPPMRSASGAGTFLEATYLLNAATLKPSFFAACLIESELIGNIVPDNTFYVKRSSQQAPISDHERVGRASSPGLFLFENTFAD